MWQKIKEQLPVILSTVVLIGLVLGSYACYIHFKVIPDMTQRQEAELASLKQQHQAELQASAEETRRQIEAVNTLLKDAIANRKAEAFMTEEEFAKVNGEKINQFVEAIAKKIQPYNPLPKTPEEAEQLQNEQADKVGGRIALKISPILEDMAKQQTLTKENIAAYSQKISDQVGVVLTNELAAKQKLNNNLMATQAVAQDSLQLSHEITALYLSSFKDQSLVTRLLSLPVNVVKDAASLSIVNSNERKQIEEKLVTKMNEIQKRLDELQKQQPK